MSATGDALSSGRVTARVTADGVSAPAALVGSLIADKYLVEAVVGEGSMGLVLRAHHLQLREPVALKILRPELARDSASVSRFLREARALARMRSEHVARVMDVGTLDDGRPFLVMELLDGRDLAAELAARRTLPMAEAVDIIVQVCEAMSEAHALGVVHRDLKPSNLFLTQRDDERLVKVIDFGIARGEALVAEGECDLTAASCVLGSPAYMAPEQVRAADTADARSDVWSLGIILYEILAGRPPFGTGNTTAVLAAICADEPEPLGRINKSVRGPIAAVVARCLAKNPSHRFETMRELQTALQRAAQGHMPRIAGRTRALAKRGALIGAVAGAAVLIMLLQGGEPRKGGRPADAATTTAEAPAKLVARPKPATRATPAPTASASAPKRAPPAPVERTRVPAAASEPSAAASGDLAAAIAERK